MSALQNRSPALDFARTLALAGMVLYHFTFDLDLFGYIPRGTSVTGYFALHARAVAGCFLFLAGMSLYLAHRGGIDWSKVARRTAVLGGAAAVITLVTVIVMPENFIFFGILHSITVASLLGLAFLRLPAVVVAGAGVMVLALPRIVSFDLFNPIWLVWIGLGTVKPMTADFEPVFPWFGPFLLGMASAKVLLQFGYLNRPQGPVARPLRWLAWPGQHSLAIYLVHQPILIGLIWLYSQLA